MFGKPLNAEDLKKMKEYFETGDQESIRELFPDTGKETPKDESVNADNNTRSSTSDSNRNNIDNKAIGELIEAVSGLSKRLTEIERRLSDSEEEILSVKKHAAEQNYLSASTIEEMIDREVGKLKEEIKTKSEQNYEAVTPNEEIVEESADTEEEYLVEDEVQAQDEQYSAVSDTEEYSEEEEEYLGDEIEENNGEGKNRKSGFKKIVFGFLATLAIAFIGLYAYGKYRQATKIAEKPVVAKAQINPVATTPTPAAYTPTTAVSTVNTNAMIDESKIAKNANDNAPAAHEQGGAIKAGKVTISDDDTDLPPPPMPDATQNTYPQPQTVVSKDRSPIEKQLLGDNRKEDISFVCRLASSYPSGDYIYYIKTENGKFIENPQEDTISISEKNIAYNYSPENKFIKLEDGKYIKTKIFDGCKPVKHY